MVDTMRVLFITNYYPPAGGGYAQLAQEIAMGLAEHGHEVQVLASHYGHGDTDGRVRVWRNLHIDPDWELPQSAPVQFFAGRRRREQADIARMRQLVADFRPQVIVIWHAIGLSRALLAQAEALPNVACAYYLAGYWPTLTDEYLRYWNAPADNLLKGLPKRLLAPLARAILSAEGKPVPLRLDHVMCVSAAVRDILRRDGVPLPHAEVVHNGVKLADFPVVRRNGPGHPLKLLYGGQIDRHKGVHTAIEAVHKLLHRHQKEVSLTLAGYGPPAYQDELRDLATKLDVADHVQFAGLIPRNEMTGFMQTFDILLFPSIYDEPLARMMQEGMACGLAVVGTTTGGSGELLRHNVNGLAFAPGDGQDMVRQVVRLLDEPGLYQRLTTAARATIEEQFTIRHTIDGVERFLVGIVAGQTIEPA